MKLGGDSKGWLFVSLLGAGACGDDGTSGTAGNTEGSTGSGGGVTTTQGLPTTSEGTSTGPGGTMTDSIGETANVPTTTTPTSVSTDTGESTATSPGTVSETNTDTSTGTGESTDASTTAPVSASDTDTGTSSGTTGEPCVGIECCMKGEVYCGETCCEVGEVCNFTKCEVPGNDCDEAEDCAGNEYCEYSLGDGEPQPPDPMCMGGVVLPTGKCLTNPPLCGPNDPPQDPEDPECLQSCEFDPAGGFNPTVKYTWGGLVNPPTASDIMMTPIVVQLDDDDCDGVVTERDIPEIVFSTFMSGQYGSNGSLHAISVENGALVDKWNVLAGAINPTKQIAGGNFDGQPGNEVVGCGITMNNQSVVYARKGEDGSALWQTPVTTCFMPSLADLDGDGSPEVIVESGILNGATGAIEATFNPPLNGSFIVADLDSDGTQDIITSSRGYRSDGTMFVNTMLAEASMFAGTQDWKSPWPAIADFDLDGFPEVVVIDNLNHALSIWRWDDNQPNDFEVVRGPVDINGALPQTCLNGQWGFTHGGGPPTVADFDGDMVPDVGTAGGIGYAVFSGAKLVDPNVPGPQTFLWAKPTTDCSSASTGSSVFDFDGVYGLVDGSASRFREGEVVSPGFLLVREARAGPFSGVDALAAVRPRATLSMA